MRTELEKNIGTIVTYAGQICSIQKERRFPFMTDYELQPIENGYAIEITPSVFWSIKDQL